MLTDDVQKMAPERVSSQGVPHQRHLKPEPGQPNGGIGSFSTYRDFFTTNPGVAIRFRVLANLQWVIHADNTVAKNAAHGSKKEKTASACAGRSNDTLEASIRIPNG